MIYLRKASNNLVSHCHCANAYIGAPAQLDCPWCGCGWLFVCADCRKAFTFAEAVKVKFSLEQIGAHDLLQFSKHSKVTPTKEDLRTWVECMKEFLHEVKLGRRYIYFDGYIVPVDAGCITFEGLHSAHALKVVPQVEALRDPTIVQGLLRNPHYWQESVIQRAD